MSNVAIISLFFLSSTGNMESEGTEEVACTQAMDGPDNDVEGTIPPPGSTTPETADNTPGTVKITYEVVFV